MFKIAIICGGPSLERGVSLNSARSIYDHLSQPDREFVVLYVDQSLNFFHIQASQLYSNTPSDFNFKLANSGKALAESQYKQLIGSCDLVFPCIHGAFGEDGALQLILESCGVPFVGSSSSACHKAFNKFGLSQHLKQHGFPTLPIIELDLTTPDWQKQLTAFYQDQGQEKIVLKPRSGGSSLGVKILTDCASAISHAQTLFQQHTTQHVVAEAFCDGREFTVVVLQNAQQLPVALPPTEVIIEKNNPTDIFNFRRKYLATSSTQRPCPPRHFSYEQIEQICSDAEKIFALFEMSDMVRIDGFVTPDGTRYFTDFNPISGMEQNSFIFQQASRIGWTHTDLLNHLLNSAMRRLGKTLPPPEKPATKAKQPVWVLFGGVSAEKEVSVMSGTNVWMKLIKSSEYEVTPFLLSHNDTTWQLPYAFCLDHTVAEIEHNCELAQSSSEVVMKLAKTIRSKLTPNAPDWQWQQPTKLSLEQFMKNAQAANAFVFLGLHGGFGEDGTIQALLDRYGIAYNGPGAQCSALCMDKLKTGECINAAKLDHLISAQKRVLDFTHEGEYLLSHCETIWQETCSAFQTKELIIKPVFDGCSCGIVRLGSAQELKIYLDMLKQPFAPAGTFKYHDSIIEMNFDPTKGLLLEPFIETVKLSVLDNQILPEKVEGWVELTVGVYSTDQGLKVMTPSITVAEGSVLALEEKFQGGTGVNLTPPLPTIISEKQQHIIQEKVGQAAQLLGIESYARIDIFFHTLENTVMVIEANTLPGLTPSTVIYHQALAETPPLTPLAFLEHLIRTRLSMNHKNQSTENDPVVS